MSNLNSPRVNRSINDEYEETEFTEQFDIESKHIGLDSSVQNIEDASELEDDTVFSQNSQTNTAVDNKSRLRIINHGSVKIQYQMSESQHEEYRQKTTTQQSKVEAHHSKIETAHF